MSIKALNWAFDLYFNTPSHKLVMLALADNATNEGLSYPFLKTIAMKSCLKIRQVQYILRKLEKEGYITAEEHFKKGNRQTSNCYQLHMDKQFESIRELSTGVQWNAGEGCSGMQGRGAVECTDTPSKTPINNNKNNNLQEIKNHQPKHITLTNNLKQQEDTFLPTWLNKELWNEFKENRVSIKKPMTPLAEKKLLLKLEKLKDAGFDPEEIINESISNGWAGLFELNKKNKFIHKLNNITPITSESRSTVKFWEKGNPDYDRIHQK